MKKMAALLVLAFSLNAAAVAYKGSLIFSDEEKARHHINLDILLAGSQECLNSALQEEENGYIYEKYGIFPLYGDNSDFSQMQNPVNRFAAIIKVLLEVDMVNTRLDRREDADQIESEVNALMKPKLADIK